MADNDVVFDKSEGSCGYISYFFLDGLFDEIHVADHDDDRYE